ncbi:MAG: iron-sulfur cluster-binding domain-containing protein [Flavitalea sp.]
MDKMRTTAVYDLYVSDIIRETNYTKSFQLINPAHDTPYQPGQFLTFLFNGKNGLEIRRSYSMSSSPNLDEPLTITVKRIDNGEISRLLHDQTKIGDKLQTIGANGFFTIPENLMQYERLIFFAAGSGIVPIYSLIKSVLKIDHRIKIFLFFSNNNYHDTIFYNGLIQLQKKNSEQLNIEFLLSDSLYLRNARLTPESMEKLLFDHEVDNSFENLFYVCGPAAYMRMIQFKLSTFGVQHSNIKKEIFKIEKPTHIRMPPDIKPHQVTVSYAKQQYKFSVEYPSTILSAAKKLKIELPFSCENGQCGTCAATCVSGKVWMSNNEVLLDEEIAKGKILTCTGFPINGDVSILI